MNYDGTDFAKKWQEYLGVFYWRVPAKARSFCVKHLNIVDAFVKERTPSRNDVEEQRTAKIIEVATALRKKLNTIKLPDVDKKKLDDFPMLEYTPTQEMKDSFPGWDGLDVPTILPTSTPDSTPSSTEPAMSA